MHAHALPAGDFSAWLREIRASLRGAGEMDVACGDCIGCCSSSMFIHVKPDEKKALGLIPKALLAPAPGRPKGHMLMGYDEHGHCPMLAAGKCTIYAERPQTCRSYDCRVFAAAGISAGGKEKTVINERVRRWSFTYPTARDREQHAAVRAAAAFVREHASSFPGGRAPQEPVQVAVVALKAYEVFLDDVKRSCVETAAAIVEACRLFDEASASS